MSAVMIGESSFSGASMMGGAMTGFQQSKSNGNGIQVSFLPWTNMSVAQWRLIYVAMTYKKIMAMTYGEGNYFWKKIKGAAGTIWDVKRKKNIKFDVENVPHRAPYIIFSKFIKSFNEIVKADRNEAKTNK
jgi:hypothetical protein